jgi:hypothetical protein
MQSKQQEIDYIEMMIKNLQDNLIEVTRFGDEILRKAINVQIGQYQKRLDELKK